MTCSTILVCCPCERRFIQRLVTKYGESCSQYVSESSGLLRISRGMLAHYSELSLK